MNWLTAHLTTRLRHQECAMRPSTLLAISSKYTPKLDGISLYIPSAGVKGENMRGRSDADTTYGVPGANWASLKIKSAMISQGSAGFVMWPHRRSCLELRVLFDSFRNDTTYVNEDVGRRTKPRMVLIWAFILP